MGSNSAAPVVRGCGVRKAGGVYWETGTSPGGKPLEHFIVDPPVLVDRGALGIAPVGVKLMERDGVWHVMDWVGDVFYPNVMDFLEETRRFGVSRRLPKNLDFAKITDKSRLLLVHSKAWIENRDDYWVARPAMGEQYPCPKLCADHKCGLDLDHVFQQEQATEFPMCASLWREDVAHGVSIPAAMAREAMDQGDGWTWLTTDRPLWMVPLEGRAVRREMPSFDYIGNCRPAGVAPVYKPAIFATFPVSRLVVIKAERDGHKDALDAATRAKVQVAAVDC